MSDNVSKKVTMLIVGMQDRTRLPGYEKSSKQRKAEALIVRGHDIDIFSESDFADLVRRVAA